MHPPVYATVCCRGFREHVAPSPAVRGQAPPLTGQRCVSLEATQSILPRPPAARTAHRCVPCDVLHDDVACALCCTPPPSCPRYSQVRRITDICDRHGVHDSALLDNALKVFSAQGPARASWNSITQIAQFPHCFHGYGQRSSCCLHVLCPLKSSFVPQHWYVKW